MNDDSPNDWKQISERLFAPRQEPTSEAFVQNVMRRIEAAEARPRILRIPVQWYAPLTGMAAMLLLAMLPTGNPLSVETLFTAGVSDSSWMLDHNAPQTDDVLGYVLEAQ